MRLLSLLLALVMVVGLIKLGAVEANAAETMTFKYAYDCQRSIAFPTKGQNVNVSNFSYPLKGDATYSNRTRFDSNDGPWTLTYLGTYGELSDRSGFLPDVVSGVASRYNMKAEDVQIHQLSRNGEAVVKGVVIAQSSTDALFLGANFNSSGGGYLLTDRLATSSFDFTIEKDIATDVHIHAWTPVTTGLGTKEATTTITCTAPGCTLNAATTVTLKASDVTLPGNVFNAEIIVGESNLRVATANGPLTVSQNPGYKYSKDGSGFTSVDPSTFEAKQGIYQASIVVMDGSQQVENLYVNYTVSDPVVTAATGDNRPIEMMLAGMVTFLALAAAAFILDAKRRASF